MLFAASSGWERSRRSRVSLLRRHSSEGVRSRLTTPASSTRLALGSRLRTRRRNAGQSPLHFAKTDITRRI